MQDFLNLEYLEGFPFRNEASRHKDTTPSCSFQCYFLWFCRIHAYEPSSSLKDLDILPGVDA